MTGKFKEIPIEKIRKLKNIRDESVNLKELEESIREYGLLQPIVVAEEKDGYHVLIFGHRRYLACQKIGKKKMPCIIRPDDDSEIIQVVENIQRRDMTKVEESAAVWNMKERMGLSIGAIGKKLGYSYQWAKKRVAFHEVREYLVATKKFTGRGIDALTFDIAWKMHKHDMKHWVKMAEHSLGKSWYPEALESDFSEIAAGKDVRKDGLYKPKREYKKNDTGVTAEPLPGGGFTIMDQGDGMLKLMFVRDADCSRMIKHLEECGGELI